MKRHNFDKLAVYTEGGTTWLMVYMVAIINAYVLFGLYRFLTACITPEISADMLQTLQGGKAGFAFAYLLFLVIDLCVAIGTSIMLPSLQPGSYRMLFVHMGSSLAAYPLTLIVTAILSARPPKGFVLPNTLFYIAWVIFSIFNMAYFVKRRNLFFTDIVKMITGQEKDLTKH
jgi:hypothetical protein